MPTITLSNLELTRFLLAIILLLVSAHFFGYLFQHFKWPKVIGEIFGGFLLGPTVLGHWWPSAQAWVFQGFNEEGKLISALYWLGLVLLMFISGFEVRTSFDKLDRKIILILVAATPVLFLAGWAGSTIFNFTPYMGGNNNSLALKIVIGIAVAVTSIPVISKTFIDLKIIHTRFAKIVLAAASAHDILLWAVLAVATGLVSGSVVSLRSLTIHIGTTMMFFGLTLALMPKFIKFCNGLRLNLLLKSSGSAYILFICFVFSALASFLNVNIVFGALLAGMAIALLPEPLFAVEKNHIKDFSFAFFIPLYFSVVGLKLDLIKYFDPLFFIGFLIITSLLQVGVTALSVRWATNDWLTGVNFGMAMNARGGPGIVLATVALDNGIINENFYSTLILTALVTSLMAGGWFQLVLAKKWELIRGERPTNA